MTGLLLPQSADGLITFRAATEAGFVPADLARMVRAGDLVRVRRGVYVEGGRWESEDEFRGRPLLRVRAALTVLRCRDFVLSHDSAALVLGMGVPDARTSLVHVTRRKVHGDAVRTGIKHHLAPYSPGQVEAVGDLRVLNMARTALDLGREHGLTAAVAGCDFALAHGVTRAELAEAREAMWCWPESRVLDAGMAMADPGAESWLESEARVLVHELGIGWPTTQFGLSDGRRSAWCDIRVGRHVFEADGMMKYAEDDGRAVLREEKSRQDFLSGFKIGVSRITAYDCRAGRPAARARLYREFADTCARYGTDIADLAPYIIRSPRRAA